MEEDALKQIQARHDLEMSALRLQRQLAEHNSALRQAKYELREAQQEQVLYGGSFRRFLDKLSGRQEEKETALRHAVQKAEAKLTAAKSQKELSEKQLSDLKQQQEKSPDWDDLRLQAEGESLQEWCRLDALLCIEVLSKLLEENHAALIEQRNMMSGANVGKIYTYAEQAETYTAPEKIGQLCKPYILRMRAALEILEIPFETYSYFQNPATFVNGVIASHNRRDRVNDAMGQVEALQQMLPKIQPRLEIESEESLMN